jgi:acyl-CoA carboxylase subunit beta
MTVLTTGVDEGSESYRRFAAHNRALAEALREKVAQAALGGPEKHRERHVARGKLLPRERVEMLLDQDSPFLALSPVAAWGSDYPVGASVVTGIGVVEGVECVVIANDPTVDGGAVNPYTVEKIRRAARIASVNRLPLINLVESTGAAAPTGPPPGGAIARDLSQLTADRVPTVCVVFGATTGDAAYLPALSDYTIMVRGHAKVLTIHPQPVRTGANGRAGSEVRSAPTVPAGVTGPADQLAEDERDGLRLARQCVRRFNWRKRGPAPRTTPPRPPRYDAEDLLTLAGRGAFDPREVLARILDDSDFDEFKPAQGTALVTGWGELHGYPIGVLANLGSAFTPAETQKAVHFIQLANATDTSLLFVQYTGPESAAEDREAADVRHGAPLVHAVAKSTVPHLTLMVGTAPAAETGGIYGRAYEPRFLFSWPVERPAAEEPNPRRKLPDDGVIDPRDTRTVLGLCLSAVHSAAVEGAEHVGVFRP